MFKMILVILVLAFAAVTHATAAVDRYECKLSNAKDLNEVSSLRLKNFKDMSMVVPFSACKLTRNEAHFDICRLRPHTLVIGVNPTRSVLLTRRGKTYEFSCLEKDNGLPDDEEEEEQEQQEQQQQQQQQQQQGEPGHGGSNIRMRGIKIIDALK